MLFLTLRPFKKKKRKDRTEQTHCLHKMSAPFRACCISLLSGPEDYRIRNRAVYFAGSLTIEAAVALPLMILAIWMLIFPLKVMESERRLQNRLETTAKALAVMKYIEQAGDRLLKPDADLEELTGSWKGAAEASFGQAAVRALPETKLMEDLRFSPDTSILTGENGADPAMIYAELYYSLHFPDSVFRLLPVRKSLVVNRRAWIGSKGGRGRERYGGTGSDLDTEEDWIVYVGKNGTRYHLDPGCHYLSNKMSSADASAIAALRNLSGARYHPCPSCRPGTSGTVYYFESGTAYHATEKCKAVTAYARAVPLSEVIHLGACSYCGRGH